MHVAITGAAGEVGRTISSAFESDRRTLFTHSEHDSVDSTLLDGTDREAFVAALQGADVLVHLAWAGDDKPGGADRWDDSPETNLRMTTNALEAARENELDRIVLASSIHVFGMYNRADPSKFESTAPKPTTTVDPETPPRPDSHYGVAKVALEALATYYADRYGLEIVVVRIGWLMPAAELRDTRTDEADRHRFARAMWLSPRDCRNLFRAAVEASLDRSPVFAHGISRNGDRYMTLTETMQRLDYRPRDDAVGELDGE